MANAYLVPGGTGVITSSTNWSTTSGGPSGYTPLSSDDLIVDANSMNAPLISTTASYLSLTFSSYTGNFTITAATTLTINSSLTYSTGMTTSGTGALNVGASTMSAASINFNGVTHNGSFSFNNGTSALTTYTITGNLNIIGTTSFANSGATGSNSRAVITGGGHILCNSGFSIYGNGNRWLTSTGGSSIYFVGTGSGNFTSGVSAYFNGVPMYLQKTGGTITMTAGAIYFRNSVLTYLSGNFVNFIAAVADGSATINTTSGMVWSSVAITGSSSFTNNGTLVIANTFTISLATVLGGTGDIHCGTLTNTVSFGLTVGKSLYIANAWNSVATAASNFLVYSSSIGTQVRIILAPAATQDIAHTNARDIDSNGGKTILSYRVVTLTNTNNWATLPIITTINTNTIVQ